MRIGSMVGLLSSVLLLLDGDARANDGSPLESCRTCPLERRIEAALSAGSPEALLLNDDGREIVMAFELLVPLLGHGSFAERSRVLDVLVDAYWEVDEVPDETFHPCAELLRRGDVLARALVLDLAEEAGEDTAQELAAAAAEDSSAWIRRKAVEVMSGWSNGDLTPTTRRALVRLAGRLSEYGREALESNDLQCDQTFTEACRLDEMSQAVMPSLEAIHVLRRLDCGMATVADLCLAQALIDGPPELAEMAAGQVADPGGCAGGVLADALLRMSQRPEPYTATIANQALARLSGPDPDDLPAPPAEE